MRTEKEKGSQFLFYASESDSCLLKDKNDLPGYFIIMDTLLSYMNGIFSDIYNLGKKASIELTSIKVFH